MRTFFFMAGLMAMVFGLELFLVDRFVMSFASDLPPLVGLQQVLSGTGPANPRVIDPPEWICYTLLSTGATTMLYALSAPVRH